MRVDLSTPPLPPLCTPAQARGCAPCILFFDELDAIAAKRSLSGAGSIGAAPHPGMLGSHMPCTDSLPRAAHTVADSNGVSERVLSTFLNEMDGVDTDNRVIVVAATNRPAALDDVRCPAGSVPCSSATASPHTLLSTLQALVRPGRIDAKVLVPLPCTQDRLAVLQEHTAHTPLAAGVDLEHLSSDDCTRGWTCAELRNLVRTASLKVLPLLCRQFESEGVCVCLTRWLVCVVTGANAGP